MGTRTARMCGGEPAVRKGPWTLEEDLVLVSYISEHGEGSWDNLARAAGLNRNGKSCRLRWLNYLRPGVRRGSITPAEDAVIRELQATLGNKWSKIAKHLPGRTDNEVKNYWRTRIQKRAPAAGMVSEGGESSSSSGTSASCQYSSAVAGECWSFMQPKTEPQQHANSRQEAVATTIIKSEGASSSALASQEYSSSPRDCCWHTQQQQASCCPYYYSHQSQLSSAADHLGMAGADASSPAQLFSSSDFSDSFWNAVINFWETIPVKGALF